MRIAAWLAAGRRHSVGPEYKRYSRCAHRCRESRGGRRFSESVQVSMLRAGPWRSTRSGTGQRRRVGQPAGRRPPRPPGPPDRSTWYAEPVKVFDNLYFFGQSEYSVWAITTSQGIIVLDTIFDYSVEDEVAGGMKKMGLDPANIKYAVVSHAHPDHDGGARFLQEHYGTRVIMSPADWDVLDKRTNGTKPKRDIEATDGQKLTLGDTTLTLYITPGHTPGTISTVFPVKDNGTPHLAALWGGVGLNPDRERVQTLHPVGAAIQRHREAGGSGYHPDQPHRLGPVQDQPADAGQTRARQSESIHRGQCKGPELSKGRRRMRHGPFKGRELKGHHAK